MLFYFLESQMNQTNPTTEVTTIQPISIQGTPIKYIVVRKEHEEYRLLEQYVHKEDIAFKWFHEPNEIPNELKGKAAENRQLIISNRVMYTDGSLDTFLLKRQKVMELNTTSE